MKNIIMRGRWKCPICAFGLLTCSNILDAGVLIFGFPAAFGQFVVCIFLFKKYIQRMNMLAYGAAIFCISHVCGIFSALLLKNMAMVVNPLTEKQSDVYDCQIVNPLEIGR